MPNGWRRGSSLVFVLTFIPCSLRTGSTPAFYWCRMQTDQTYDTTYFERLTLAHITRTHVRATIDKNFSELITVNPYRNPHSYLGNILRCPKTMSMSILYNTWSGYLARIEDGYEGMRRYVQSLYFWNIAINKCHNSLSLTVTRGSSLNV